MNEAEAKANKLKVSFENLCGIVTRFLHFIFRFYYKLVANSCDAREQILDEFQAKKSLFLSWSSKQKCIKFYIYIYIYILKEIAQSFISQTEERNVVLFISFFVRRNKRQNVESLI